MSEEPSGALAACRIQGRLGEGGIAEVFLAEWEGRQVALKMLRRVGHAGLTRRFLREGRLLQRIHHHHIVRCLQVVEGDTPALILELLNGESLDRRLARGPLTAEDAERLAVAMLDALACIHEDGIVHRDVKASNVWWGADGRVVLMDLGLAADSADPLTTTLGEVVGTYAYMAPEQILGAPSDHRCDLYALGITLYEALTGARPYQARGLEGYLAAHRSGRAVLVSRRCPQLPLRLTTLVDRLMARDPAARPASARVAMAMLQAEPPARGALGRPALVGREAARGAVAALLDEGGVLWLTGGPGAGLGVIARTALAQAAEEGVEAIQARLGPRQSLADLVGSLAAGVERFGFPFAPTAEGVAAAIVALAAEAVQGRPCGRFLVVLEDLDLAPPAVAAWVASWVDTRGLALVATGESPRGPVGRVLPLRPLKLEETRLLISGLLRTGAVPTGLDLRVHALTGGQPTWIVQLVNEGVTHRWLSMEGRSTAGEPTWSWDVAASASSFASAGAPDARILERLPPASRRMLELLAVAGTALPVHVLLRAAEGDASGVDLALPLRLGAVRRELRQDEEWVDLRRASLAAVLWAALAPEARRERHAALAEAADAFLVEVNGETGPARTAGGSIEAMRRMASLQRAWAGDGEGLVDALLNEAAAALASGRPEEALRLLDGPGPAHAPTAEGSTAAVQIGARLALLRGRALMTTGQLPEARAALHAARSLVKASAPPAALADELAVAEAAWGLAIAHRIAASAWEAVCLRAHRVPVGDRVEEARALLLVAERERRAGRLREAADRAAQARLLTRERLSEEGRGTPGSRGPSGGVLNVYEESLLVCVEIAGLRGELDRAQHLLAEHAVSGFGSAGQGGDPTRACRARVLGCGLAASRGQLGAALELLRAPVEGAWSRAALEVARLELEIELGVSAVTVALARGLGACGDPTAPWPIRRAWLRAVALTRLAAGDPPAALDALLAGADAADAAEDFPEHALHTGLVALLTGRPERLGDAVERLADAGLPRYQATLLLHGARSTGDPEVLVAAEGAARASGDRMLLLPILQARRGSGAREEAAAICRGALAGLHGPERLRFEERREVRWALG